MFQCKRFIVGPVGDQWGFKEMGHPRPIQLFPRERDAVSHAAEQARQQVCAQVLVQGTDGKFRLEYTYPRARDKFPPRG